MARGLLTTTLAAVCAALGVAGCSGSNATHVQTPGNSTPAPVSSSDPNTSSASTPSSPSTTVTTPSGFGPAQPAVAAYLSYMAQLNKGLANPPKFDPASAARYAAGQAKLVLTGAVSDELKHGNAWRGTPWRSRVEVTSSKLDGTLPEVVMTDCPLPDKSYAEYVVKTGRTLPAATTKVPPPFTATIRAFQPNRKSWVITSYTVDGSKTCTR